MSLPHLSLAWLTLISGSVVFTGVESSQVEPQTQAPCMLHTKPHILDLGLPPLIYLFKLFELCQTGVSSICLKFSLCSGHWHCLQKQLPKAELQNRAGFRLDERHFLSTIKAIKDKISIIFNTLYP